MREQFLCVNNTIGRQEKVKRQGIENVVPKVEIPAVIFNVSVQGPLVRSLTQLSCLALVSIREYKHYFLPQNIRIVTFSKFDRLSKQMKFLRDQKEKSQKGGHFTNIMRKMWVKHVTNFSRCLSTRAEPQTRTARKRCSQTSKRSPMKSRQMAL